MIDFALLREKMSAKDLRLASRCITKVMQLIRSSGCKPPSRKELHMSLLACHGYGAAIDFERLLDADGFTLLHDVLGIDDNIEKQPETGRLLNHFYPRTACGDGILLDDNSTLYMVLKHKWYDQMESGEKDHEYRETSGHWNKLLSQKKFTKVCFARGYTQFNLKFRIVSIKRHICKNDLGITDRDVWDIKLGMRLKY